MILRSVKSIYLGMYRKHQTLSSHRPARGLHDAADQVAADILLAPADAGQRSLADFQHLRQIHALDAVGAHVFVECHDGETYAPCNLAVKPKLHGAAFSPYTGCAILPAMASNRHYLKQWRRHRGLTQAQVIGRLELIDDPNVPRTEASLSRIEGGKQIYTQRLLLALADIYQAEPWELLGRDPSKDGLLVDLVRRLQPHQQAQAQAVIEGLLLAEERSSFTPPEPPTDRLRPRKVS